MADIPPRHDFLSSPENSPRRGAIMFPPEKPLRIIQEDEKEIIESDTVLVTGIGNVIMSLERPITGDGLVGTYNEEQVAFTIDEGKLVRGNAADFLRREYYEPRIELLDDDSSDEAVGVTLQVDNSPFSLKTVLEERIGDGMYEQGKQAFFDVDYTLEDADGKQVASGGDLGVFFVSKDMLPNLRLAATDG